MAATMEILTNILELDPGMQLSRKLGGELLFIPRIKHCKADPKLVHHRPMQGSNFCVAGQERPACAPKTAGGRCRKQEVGMWKEELRGHKLSVLSCTRQVVVATGGSLICNFMKLVFFSANDCIKRRSFPCLAAAAPVE
jgi:hypothetical protein